MTAKGTFTFTFATALALAVCGAQLTDGWRNNGRFHSSIPPAPKALWTAPLEKGLDAFTVTWSGRGLGTVRIVDTPAGKALEIVKTNDVGSVVIRPRDALTAERRFNPLAFVAVTSSAEDFEFSSGELKVGPPRKERIAPSEGCRGTT